VTFDRVVWHRDNSWLTDPYAVRKNISHRPLTLTKKFANGYLAGAFNEKINVQAPERALSAVQALRSCGSDYVWRIDPADLPVFYLLNDFLKRIPGSVRQAEFP
jgi:hypothetical protein